MALAEQPLCVACELEGRVTLAQELDHIIPLCDGGADSPENLQPLCKPCHRAKTAADMAATRRPEIGVDGWPVDDGAVGRTGRGGRKV